jgi:hypothetical protein
MKPALARLRRIVARLLPRAFAGAFAGGLAIALIGGIVLPSSAEAQRGFGRFCNMPDVPPNAPYDGQFAFVRIWYEGTGACTNEGPGWAHDYPWGEQNLMKIMNEVTSLKPNLASSQVLALDDPELFKYPVAYMSEPGHWFPSPAEVEGFRKYLLKGGFVIFDDFRASNEYWFNFLTQMNKVLPGMKPIPLEDDHAIFDSFFAIDPKSPALMGSTYSRQSPHFLGIFVDNDPTKRMLAVVNLDADIGDSWQWSGQGFFPIPVSNEAFKLGVNYLIFGMTR